MEQIRELLEQLVPMSEADWQFFAQRLRPVSFHRSDVITAYEQVESRLYFLIKGINRHTAGYPEETTFDFALPGQFFCAYSSFVSRKPSMYEITPLSREVDCLYISHESLQQVYANTKVERK